MGVEVKLAIAEPAPDLRAVYDAEFDHVWRTLRRLGIRDCDLEDLCHDVFIVVHRILGQYDPTRPIRPWLSGIAFRVASDHRRKARHRREVATDRLQALAREPRADDLLALRQQQAVLLAALEELADERRIVLVMHDLDGSAMPEISLALGVPLNTAYSRLRLARAELTAAVARRTRRRVQ